MSILNEFVKQQEEDFYLRNTTYVNHIPEVEFRNEVVALYNRPEAHMRLLGTLLNAIYTDGKPTFFLSKRRVYMLVETDAKNLTYKGRPGVVKTDKIVSDLINYIKSSPSFVVCYESSKEKKTPFCIQLINPSTIGQMGHQMAIKLASNWHQMAIKTRQAMELKDESVLSNSVKDKAKAYYLTGGLGDGLEKIKIQENRFSLTLPLNNSSPLNSIHPEPTVDANVKANPSKCIPVNPSNPGIKSMESVYLSWTASLPTQLELKNRADYLYSLFFNLKESGFDSTDLTQSFKSKVISKFVPINKPKSVNQSAYETWKQRTLDEYEKQLAIVFYKPIKLKVAPVIESEEKKQISDDEWDREQFYRVTGLPRP